MVREKAVPKKRAAAEPAESILGHSGQSAAADPQRTAEQPRPAKRHAADAQGESKETRRVKPRRSADEEMRLSNPKSKDAADEDAAGPKQLSFLANMEESDEVVVTDAADSQLAVPGREAVSSTQQPHESAAGQQERAEPRLKRSKAGEAAIRQITFHQNTHGLLIPRVPCQRLVKELVQREHSDKYRFHSQALVAL
eukprot:TRINITY_DN4558_c0_g1_i1.p1 TRINITY_DN4558_c0_g1~~TRINITY_DN4558_c0_g1_i1.p1  ORF type:complete len:197 (-),score=44.14 TRINITY_DN4558_c0_g1_i1:623-1213(-)